MPQNLSAFVVLGTSIYFIWKGPLGIGTVDFVFEVSLFKENYIGALQKYKFRECRSHNSGGMDKMGSYWNDRNFWSFCVTLSGGHIFWIKLQIFIKYITIEKENIHLYDFHIFIFNKKLPKFEEKFSEIYFPPGLLGLRLLLLGKVHLVWKRLTLSLKLHYFWGRVFYLYKNIRFMSLDVKIAEI